MLFNKIKRMIEKMNEELSVMEWIKGKTKKKMGEKMT